MYWFIYNYFNCFIKIIKGSCLFVGNLSSKVTKENLEELFGKYGEIEYVNMIEEPGDG